jgi:hypothetical protein
MAIDRPSPSKGWVVRSAAGALVLLSVVAMVGLTPACGSSASSECTAACQNTVALMCYSSCNCSMCSSAPASCEGGEDWFQCVASATSCLELQACPQPPSDCGNFWGTLCPASSAGGAG